MTNNFSTAQKQILAELRAHFGIEVKDVSLDESGELFFSLDALNLLTIRLAGDIQALSVHSQSFDNELAIATSHASVTLADGRHRGCCKSAQVGEEFPGGKIETLIQAANIADSRAARAALRAVGFDPVREFESFLFDEETVRPDSISQEEKDRRYIHKVRDELKMTDAIYRKHLSVVTLGQKATTEGMTAAQLSMCAIYFKGLAHATTRQQAA